jgi:predicted DNA-binding ribbon-helix-helix protein
VPRMPNEWVPISARIKGEVYNRLIDAAIHNDRSLGNEIELRLERSFFETMLKIASQRK